MAQTVTWQGIARGMARHWQQVLAAHVVALVATAGSVVLPIIIPLLIDELLLHNPGHLLPLARSLAPVAAWAASPLWPIALSLALIVCLRVVVLVCSVWQERSFALVAKEALHEVRLDMLSRLRVMCLSSFELRGPGAIAAHFTQDLDTVDAFVSSTVSKLILGVLSLVGVAAVLLWLHWQLALCIVVINPLVITLTTRIANRVARYKRAENQAVEQFQSQLTETIDGIREVRLHGGGVFWDRLQACGAALRSAAATHAWKSQAASQASQGVFFTGIDVFRALSIVAVLWSNLTVGMMFGVVSYLWFMIGPVQQVLSIQYAWANANMALSRINQLLASEAEDPRLGPHNPFAGHHTVGVSLRKVSFAYDPEQPVLSDISLDIAPGERVALVGASGGGKSTLVQLLVGAYRPSHGTICYGGVPLEDIGLPRVRAHVGCVLQHPMLFNESLRFNLALGREHHEEALWEALETAQLAQFVRGLAQGLDTPIGNRGVRLSGGQRQRVAIARLVLAAPHVVILDEATSALDTATEAAVHAHLRRFLAGRTTIIVAHRLSAVREADRVLVFDGGGIAESGDHRTLSQSGGLYAALYSTQG